MIFNFHFCVFLTFISGQLSGLHQLMGVPQMPVNPGIPPHILAQQAHLARLHQHQRQHNFKVTNYKTNK